MREFVAYFPADFFKAKSAGNKVWLFLNTTFYSSRNKGLRRRYTSANTYGYKGYGCNVGITRCCSGVGLTVPAVSRHIGGCQTWYF